MRSFIKIYGPPIYGAIKALERIAIDMPEVCIMDKILEFKGEKPLTEDEAMAYFYAGQAKPAKVEEVLKERCHRMISKSGVKLGEYDFYFEWFETPDPEQLNKLIQKIDDALTPLGCRYTITTKR
jgi:hypothetical protein